MTSGMVPAQLTAAPAPIQSTAVPGWNRVKGRGVELWLPPQYQGGSPSAKDTQTMLKGLATLGSQYAELARVVEKNPDAIALYAVDVDRTTGRVASVIVSPSIVPESMPLEVFIDLFRKTPIPGMRVVEQKMTRIPDNSVRGGVSQPAGRLVVETTVRNITVRQLVYVIKRGTTVWSVAYSTGVNEYSQRLPAFEKSIRTFRTTASNDTQQTSAVPLVSQPN